MSFFYFYFYFFFKGNVFYSFFRGSYLFDNNLFLSHSLTLTHSHSFVFLFLFNQSINRYSHTPTHTKDKNKNKNIIFEVKNNSLWIILGSFFIFFIFFCIFIKKIIFFHNYFFLFFRGELYKKSIKREILSCEREKGRERLHYEFYFLMWLCTMKRKEKNKEIFEKNDWVNKNYYFFWNENLFLIFDNTYLISFLFCFPFWERERERERGVFFFFSMPFH